MPYIKQEDRKRYDDVINELRVKLFEAADENSITCFPGHLNYIITALIKRTYEGYVKRETTSGKLCYNDYNSIIGMLSCCLQEYYRKQISIYEDEKEKQSGAV